MFKHSLVPGRSNIALCIYYKIIHLQEVFIKHTGLQINLIKIHPKSVQMRV